MLYHWEKTTPDKVYLKQPINGVWRTWTWKQAGDEVRRMAAVLKAMNLPNNSNIAMISKNCAHWILSDLAIMMSGHVSVPMYPNLTAQSIKQILEHSGSKVLFVGKLDDWQPMKPGVPDDVKCISFPFYPHKEYENWEDLIKKQDPIPEDVKRDPKELATIVYTSGTTGVPKGVMHKFHNLAFAAGTAMPHLNIDNTSKFFSYLPLSHVAERLLVEMGSIYVGGEVSFAESLDTFPKNLAEARPTVFLGVHRIWTKFQQGVLAKLPQHKLDILLKIPVLSGLIKKKIKKGLGLIDAKNVLTGAAPTPVELMEWFETIGIKIQEAYAATESCCYSHATLMNHIKIGYVGQPLPHCEVKLGDDNEILIRHEALMDGYYKEPGITKEAFTSDGFLHTGDAGEIDREGFLKITGRVKDIFKTSKGNYVAPSPIEMKIAGHSNVIEQVCVVGTGLPQPVALVVLSESGKKRPKERVQSKLEHTLSEINSTLDAQERLERIVVVKNEWTVENGMLTPSMKIKRNEVEKAYSANYEKWGAQASTVVWEV
ncbi:MAG: AMP-binding protein [Bacteroidetes bacterium]|nr:AMP-binding protein [Bacteroidota bacterium]